MFIDLIPDCESNGLGSWWWDHLEEAHRCSLMNDFLRGLSAHRDGLEASRPLKTLLTTAT